MGKHRCQATKNQPKPRSNQLYRRLASYSFAAGAAVALGGRADAEVTYSNPDDIALTSTYEDTNFDIDGSGPVEFQLKIGNNRIYIKIIGTDYYTAGNFMRGAAAIGAPVNYGEANWQNSGSYYTGVSDGVRSIWGVRFDCGGAERCNGWIRYEGTASGGAVITDWAYEEVSGRAIRAGATASSWALYTAAWASYTNGAAPTVSPPASSTTDATIYASGAAVPVTADWTAKNLILLSGYFTFPGSNTITIHGDVYNSSLEKRLGVGGSIVLSSPITIDTKPPVPGGAGAISNTGAALSWTKATDINSSQSSLQYRVYQSSTDNLTTTELVELATPIGDWTTDIATWNSGIIPNDWFNVIVKDEANNKAIYTQAQYVAEQLPPSM